MRLSLGRREFDIEPREMFWGGVIALAVAWFFLFRTSDPLLAALAIPVELVATYILVRPHIMPPHSERDDDEDAPTDAE